MSKVRVRFAPSPTGFLHIGGMRSALFNWLYAKRTDGEFILRMEDTDRERYVPEAVEHIKESHHWLGLDPDRYVVQSERLEIYRTAAEELAAKGQLYPCWCSPERLDQLRESARTAKRPFKYDRHCLNNPRDLKEPHVLRFKVPETPKQITWDDAVRGQMKFNIASLDDFVAIKSDSYPTYNFANVVDDHEMQISHVLRAEEFLSSTPKHLLLYAAFGWNPPIFAHLPQVLGPDGRSKLSKRHGAESMLEYRDRGYLPEALINYMALLGWNEGEGNTKEIYDRDELIKAFALERVQRSPAIFDQERLLWLNGVWIRRLSLNDLAKRAVDFWPAAAKSFDSPYKRRVLALVQERLKTLGELSEFTDFFFARPTRQVDPDLRQHLAQAAAVAERTPFELDKLEQAFRALAGKLDISAGQLFMPIRLALTGKTASPGLFETMMVLGRNETVVRLKEAAEAS